MRTRRSMVWRTGTGAVVLAAIAGFGLITGTSAVANWVVQSVQVGGADKCGPPPGSGCDKNYSMSVIEFADGSVKGQFTDRFSGGGLQGFQATIDCLLVVDSFSPFPPGKIAWVSGTITKGMSSGGQNLAGESVWTAVGDFGTSSNDTPDGITFSVIGTGVQCYEMPTPIGPAFLYAGQVTIK